MTRTTKANDTPHNNPDPALPPQDPRFPKNYGKATAYTGEPKGKTKKDGGGKGNWGHPGDECEDMDDFNPTNPRRRSNSMKGERHDLKSKFEMNDDGPVFEEDIHGPSSSVDAKQREAETLEDHMVDKETSD